MLLEEKGIIDGQLIMYGFSFCYCIVFEYL